MSDGLTSLTEPYSIRSPNRVSYGFGTVSEIGAYAEEHGLKSALVVTDADIVAAGVIDPVVDALEGAGVSVDLFEGVKPEPKLSMVADGVERLREGSYEFVVGVGGGSALDTAKLASIVAEHDVEPADTLGMGNVPGPGLPLGLVPTTAGTGSEVTHIGVFSDDDGMKRVVYDDHLFADVVAVDPALTASLPKRVAAATGLDALTHAIESYTSVLRTPYTDVLARNAIERIGANLGEAVHQGEHNDRARYEMLLASTIAGQAFVNSGLGAVHALTYPIGIEYGVGHGEANAMLLPHVMAYNVPAEPERYAEVGDLLVPEATGSTRERAEAGVDAVFSLTEDVGIPTSIGHLGEIDRETVERFTDVAFEYSRHNIDRNPRSLDREDVIEIYRSAR
ncbi:iron-containing alcohol dehydrogenase family protein [Natronorarus salvus]|uniref:iron-containing alcohol dehydrogenase family protein n=1 Tax=Natronorarus salvus TaxID=3117733 RepID=UPI002F2601C8